jgi:hypothetical protein
MFQTGIARDVLCKAQVAPANRTAMTAIKGAGVARGQRSRALMIFYVGVTGAATTADFKVQQSDTDVDGNYADVAGAAAVQIGASQTNLVGMVECTVTKSYVRCVHTPDGTVANGILGGCHLILFSADAVPETNDPVAVAV